MERRWATIEAGNSERAAYWRHAVSNAFLSIDVDGPVLESDFSGEIAASALNRLRVSRVRSAAHRVVRRRRDLDSGLSDSLFLNLQLAGRCRMTQGDRELDMREGDAALFFGNERFQLEFPDSMTLVCIEVPRDHWPTAPGQIERLRVLNLSKVPVMGPLLASYMGGLAQIEDVPSAPLREALELHLLDLVGMTVSAAMRASEADSRSYREAIYGRACQLIASTSTDSDLNPGELASRMGLPLRSLSRAFSDCGDTIAGRLRSVRLRHAAEVLSGTGRLSVSQIAFECGFGDLSSFNRAFRVAYEVTPSEYRARARSRQTT